MRKQPGIARYLKQWSVEPDGDGFETAWSWLQPVRRAGRPAMLKLCKPRGDEQNAAAVLRYHNGRAAVRVFEADARALLMERATGERSLVTMALAGQDVEAAHILADTVIALWAPGLGPPPDTLTPLRDYFRSLFDHETADPLLGRCADTARRLLSTAGDLARLHGDVHHYNVVDGGPDRGWLAIDPKGLIGERCYEVANLLRNPSPHADLVHDRDRMARLARLYADRLGLDVQRVLRFAFAHAGLSAAWYMEDDGEDPGYSLRCAEILAGLIA